jgi:hypothetical protein
MEPQVGSVGIHAIDMVKFKIYQVGDQIMVEKPTAGEPCVFMSKMNLFEMFVSVSDTFEVVIDSYTHLYMGEFKCDVKPNKRRWMFRILSWTEQIIAYQNQKRYEIPSN